MLEIPLDLPQILRDKLAVEVSFLTEIQISLSAATWTPPNVAKPDPALANHSCGWRTEGCHCLQFHCRAVKMSTSPFASLAAQAVGLPVQGSPQSPPAAPAAWEPFRLTPGCLGGSPLHSTGDPSSSCTTCPQPPVLMKSVIHVMCFAFSSLFFLVRSLPN